jgi:hypothetical protein
MEWFGFNAEAMVSSFCNGNLGEANEMRNRQSGAP